MWICMYIYTQCVCKAVIHEMFSSGSLSLSLSLCVCVCELVCVLQICVVAWVAAHYTYTRIHGYLSAIQLLQIELQRVLLGLEDPRCSVQLVSH
jgi:hypothetical protein